VPSTEKLAVVSSADALPKVTVPGPETTLHAWVRVDPAGRPSSVTVPFRLAEPGRTMDWSAPALTLGAWLVGGGVPVIAVSHHAPKPTEFTARTWKMSVAR
jgi:hypothetical protein